MFAIVFVRRIVALTGVHVGVSRDADDVRMLDGIHREDLFSKHLDSVFEQDELVSTARKLDESIDLVG